MSSDPEMLALFRKEYPEGKLQVAIADMWDVEATASMEVNPKTGKPGLAYFWQLEKCSVCGSVGCVFFQQSVGYRCEDCRSAAMGEMRVASEPPLISYTGDLDASGDYEHEQGFRQVSGS